MVLQLHPLDLRLQASLTLKIALEARKLAQPFFTGDVAIAAITSGHDFNHGPFRQFMEDEEGNVELFHPDKTLSQIITRDFKHATHPSASMVPGLVLPHGRFVQQRGLSWWMPSGGNENEVAFQDLAIQLDANSPLYRLFDSTSSPISRRFDETPSLGCPPPANFAEGGSSFFGHVPVFALDGYTLLDHRFPRMTVPMLLLIDLDEIFHPNRHKDVQGTVPDRGSVDKHWFAVQELLDTAEGFDANHLSRRGFVRGVFNKANGDVVERISRMISKAASSRTFALRLMEYERDLAEEQGRYEEWKASEKAVQARWSQRLHALDSLLQLSVHHHVTRAPEPPHRPLLPISQYHPGSRNNVPSQPSRRPVVCGPDQQHSWPIPSQSVPPPPHQQFAQNGAEWPRPVAVTAGPRADSSTWSASSPQQRHSPLPAPSSASPRPEEGSYRLNRRLNPRASQSPGLPYPVTPTTAPAQPSYTPEIPYDPGRGRQHQPHDNVTPQQRLPYPVSPRPPTVLSGSTTTVAHPQPPLATPPYPPTPLLPGRQADLAPFPPSGVSPFYGVYTAYSPPPASPISRQGSTAGYYGGAVRPAGPAQTATSGAPASYASYYAPTARPASTPAITPQPQPAYISRPSSVASASSAGSGTAAPAPTRGPQTFDEMGIPLPQEKSWWRRGWRGS